MNEWMILLPCDQKLAESQFSPIQNAEHYGVREGPVEVLQSLWAINIENSEYRKIPKNNPQFSR